MLGFKFDMPRRESTLKDKARPIYLDMQVRIPLPFFQAGHSARKP